MCGHSFWLFFFFNSDKYRPWSTSAVQKFKKTAKIKYYEIHGNKYIWPMNEIIFHRSFSFICCWCLLSAVGIFNNSSVDFKNPFNPWQTIPQTHGKHKHMWMRNDKTMNEQREKWKKKKTRTDQKQDRQVVNITFHAAVYDLETLCSVIFFFFFW